MILDEERLRSAPQQAMTAAIAAGVNFFQYRNKGGSRRIIYHTSLQLASIARNAGALFIVNDHADIAAAVDAGGVHLGQDDLPLEYARKLLGKEKLIGVSTHSLEEAIAAGAAGADYIGFGPVFETATKDAGRARGVDSIRTVKESVSIPLIAIGGITHATAQDVIRAGADGIAIISAILSAPDVDLATKQMIKLIGDAAA